MSFRLKIAVALAAVWAVAGAGIYFARSAKPTPESVAARLQPQTLDSKSPAQRAKIIDSGASMLNRLTFEERQQLRRDRVPEKFFAALTPAEQGKFLDETLPTGFRQMMESFNKMEP